MNAGTDFPQFLAVLAASISSTIGVCVYLLRTQQKEREASEKARQAERERAAEVWAEERARAEKREQQRIDRLFELLDKRAQEQTEVLRELSETHRELSASIRDLTERIDSLERHQSPSPRRPAMETKDSNVLPSG